MELQNRGGQDNECCCTQASHHLSCGKVEMQQWGEEKKFQKRKRSNVWHPKYLTGQWCQCQKQLRLRQKVSNCCGCTTKNCMMTAVLMQIARQGKEKREKSKATDMHLCTRKLCSYITQYSLLHCQVTNWMTPSDAEFMSLKGIIVLQLPWNVTFY